MTSPTCPHCSAAVPSTDTPIAACPVCGRPLSASATDVTLDPPSAQANVATLDPAPDRASRLETLPPADEPSAPTGPSDPTLPATIGRFEVSAKLGEGAFGVVYRAYDPMLDREVAVKVGKPHMLDTPDRVQRFLREAKAAANLRHPHIVPLFETGRDGDRHYIVSAFVEGQTLETLIEERGEHVPWNPREAAALIRKLAEALAYAHSQGIVHRDLKPANVLVDERGDPHVLDFGLASRGGDEIVRTQDGKILGTPAYMSPEQAAGKAREAGPAADQYALGIMLYELLTGRRPFDGPMEIVIFNHIRTEPKRLRAVHPGVPWELEAVGQKCLEKDPAKRYGSCTELAEDLDRWVEGRSVSAKRPGPLGRAAKWARRNPVVAGLLLLVGLTMTAGTGISLWQAGKATAAARSAEANAQTSREEQQRAEDEKRRAEANEKLAQKSADLAKKQQKRAETELNRAEIALYAGNLDRAQSAFSAGKVIDARKHLERCPIKLSGWEHDYLWSKLRSRQMMAGHTDIVMSICVSPDGRQIISGGHDKAVKVWDAESGKELRTLAGHRKAIRDVCVSSDGRRIVSGSWDMSVKIWDAGTGDELRSLTGHTGGVESVCISTDNRSIVSGSDDGVIIVWDAKRKKKSKC